MSGQHGACMLPLVGGRPAHLVRPMWGGGGGMLDYGGPEVQSGGGGGGSERGGGCTDPYIRVPTVVPCAYKH